MSRDAGLRPMGDLSDLEREIDTKICSLHRIAGTLRERVEDARPEGAGYDPVRAEDRSRTIAAMRRLHTELQTLIAFVAKNGIAAETLHKTASEGAAAGRGGPGRAPRAKTGGSPRPGDPPGDGSLSLPWANPADRKPTWARLVASPPHPPVNVPTCQMVPVAGSVAIEAVVLPAAFREPKDVFEAVAPGVVYFVPSWNHFAIRVGPCVFHGNLGLIYQRPLGSGGIERVNECRRARCERAHGPHEMCHYYHDPERFPGSSDVRNYVPEAWAFTPAAAPGRYGSRRIGSADSLESDLQALGAEDARRMLSQVAHDLILGLVVWHHLLAARSSGPRPGRR